MVKTKYSLNFKRLKNVYRTLSFPLLIGFHLTNHFLTEALEKPVFIYDIIGLQVYNYTVKIRILHYR